MYISLIIPTLRLNGMVDRCVKSFENQYGELIIVDDKEKSLAQKINIGLELASGDYLIVSNDDVVSSRGHLADLCEYGKVLSPMVNEGVFKKFHAHLFCLPKEIYREVGGYDESFDGVYYIDSDYWIRLKDAGYTPEICEKVSVDHRHPASTISTLPERERSMSRGREWFISKHGYSRLAEVE